MIADTFFQAVYWTPYENYYIFVLASNMNSSDEVKITTDMIHTLPELPYAPEALAPALSAETIEFHYGKHFQTYIDNLNRMIEGSPYEDMEIEEIVMKAGGAIFNNAAQAWNHDFYFQTLTPVRTEMPDLLKEKIEKAFGSVSDFKTEFIKAASTIFGSGWAWLCESKEKTLSIVQTQNADNPMTQGLKPLLTADVWEHAYYIDYRNRRAAYLEAVWDLIDWEKVSKRLI